MTRGAPYLRVCREHCFGATWSASRFRPRRNRRPDIGGPAPGNEASRVEALAIPQLGDQGSHTGLFVEPDPAGISIGLGHGEEVAIGIGARGTDGNLIEARALCTVAAARQRQAVRFESESGSCSGAGRSYR